MARGRRAGSVPVHGILLLDKPAGLTSNRALQKIKRHLNAAKAGHTGSLDPAATGLLPLCFGDATKVTGFLLDADKTYAVGAQLGIRTASGDLDSDVVAEARFPDWDLPAWEAHLAGFVGEQDQVPPMYSALKHEGQRLYRLARRGEEVARPPRRIVVRSISDIAIAGDRLSFVVRCSKGTYIRSLVEDVAAAAGTLATTAALRRTGLGPFDATAMRPLDGLLAAEAQQILADLLPIDAALAGWPAVTLDSDAARRFTHGQTLSLDAPAQSGLVRVRGPGNRLFGLAELDDDGRLRPNRVFADGEKPS